MLVYLAQPIDQTKVQHGMDNITTTLASAGISWFRPGGAFRLFDSPLSELETVDRINCFALAAADALVAWLPPKAPTLGVPAEIEESLRSGKPTLILVDPNMYSTSVQLRNWAGRGAHVIAWTHSMSESWIANPTLLIDLLRQKPEPDWATTQLGPGTWVSRETPPAAIALERVFPPDLQVKLEPGARVPARAHDDDAGLDLAILNDETLSSCEYRLLPTGVRAAVPTGWWGMITGRSSTWAKHRCQVQMAVIDSGYRGELMIGLQNLTMKSITFPAGTRLAQYVLLPTFHGQVRTLGGDEELPDHARGENGYGSSGL